MNNRQVLDVYCKEREYQNTVFGANKSFNVASFLQFLEIYLTKAKKGYVEKWSRDLPNWLESCKESDEQSTAPIVTYEQLIKIMALAGQALERFTEINAEEWRSDGIKDKWRDVNEK